MMDLTVSRTEQTGLAEQLARQVRAAIACGRLKPGDALPAVRATATNLGIAPMTVSAAYQALVAEGHAVRQPGRRLTVAPTARQLTSAERMALLEPALRDVARQAREANLPLAAIEAALLHRMQ